MRRPDRPLEPGERVLRHVRRTVPWYAGGAAPAIYLAVVIVNQPGVRVALLAAGTWTVIIAMLWRRERRWSWRLTTWCLESGWLNVPRGAGHQWITLQRISRVQTVVRRSSGPLFRRWLPQDVPRDAVRWIHHAVVIAYPHDGDPRFALVIPFTDPADATALDAELNALVHAPSSLDARAVEQ